MIRAIQSVQDLKQNLPFGRARSLAQALERDLVRNLDRDLKLAKKLANRDKRINVSVAYTLIRMNEGSTNLYGANLSKVRLDGANVEGTIIVNCTGLSNTEIDNLKKRGAIIDNPPDSRSEVFAPIH